jgi:hypothetical protein
MECFDIRGNGNCMYNFSDEESLITENKNGNIDGSKEKEKDKDKIYLSSNIITFNDLKGKNFLKYFEEIDEKSKLNKKLK